MNGNPQRDPFCPPWLGALLLVLAAVLATIHIFGRLGFATTWMYVLLAVVVLGVPAGLRWRYQLVDAYHRIRARRYADEPEQAVEQVPGG